MSLPEVLLWQALRQRPSGLKFRRQFPGDRITTDFACLSHRLIIEVDGEAHSFGDRPRSDQARDALIRKQGFHVLRIPAREVLKDIDMIQFVYFSDKDVVRHKLVQLIVRAYEDHSNEDNRQ